MESEINVLVMRVHRAFQSSLQDVKECGEFYISCTCILDEEGSRVWRSLEHILLNDTTMSPADVNCCLRPTLKT